MRDKDLIGADFLGVIKIKIGDLPEKAQRQSYYLKNKNFEDDGNKRGTITLGMQWSYDVDAAKKAQIKRAQGVTIVSMFEKKKLASETGGGQEDEESIEQELKEQDLARQEEERQKISKARQEEAERVAKLKVEDGDYVVKVHIIEVRDLKAEDANGTSDPVVYVEAFGQEQHTIVKQKQNSCVFDTLFFFNAKDVDRDQLEMEQITVSVFDADTFSRNDLIGRTTFDVLNVYYRKNHEMYKQWVGYVQYTQSSRSLS